MSDDPVVADYLRAIGAPDDAAEWPDSRFYPAILPPRIFAFIHRYAREQHGRPLPARWEAHKDPRRHRCYATAGGAALHHRALIYCEGVDFSDDDPRPIPHAWNVDPAFRSS